MKILIVDDDYGSRSFLETLLQEEGYDILSAQDGSRAFEMIRKERPSLIVSDILMPGIDGFQLLKAVRNDPETRDIPVIFFTGSYVEPKDRELALALGVNRYLLKPMGSADVLDAVREVLAGTSGGRGPEKQAAGLEEPVFLKLYNERLVGKLKSKMIESEQNRLFLEHLLESMGDGVVVVGRDYVVTQANNAAAAALRSDKADIIGRKCFEAFHRRTSPCEGPDVTCPLPQICRGASGVTVLHTHIDSEGDEHQVEINVSPIKNSRGEVIATVQAWRDMMGKKTDDELVKLVKRLNEAQTRLRRAVITDELTGLRNRRYIVERLEEEFRRAKRSGRPLGLIMLDIDHFKQINDEFGHLFGDVVLRVIAERIKACLRRHDLVGRVGGEEFLVVCPESSAPDTVLVAERIRKFVYSDPVGDGINEVRVALSAGVTIQAPEDSSSDKVFSRADSALYQAKAEGRNRVVVL